MWRTRRIHSPRRIIKIRRVCVARVTARLRCHWACLLGCRTRARSNRGLHITKIKPSQYDGYIFGAPGAIRTRSPRLRRAMLYPVEPRVHLRIYYKYLSVKCKALTMTNNPIIQHATFRANCVQESECL